MPISLPEFAQRINALMPVIFKEFSRRHSNELLKGKISLPQFLVLAFLNQEGELKMKNLASLMHVTTAAMTGIVDRLVRHAEVERIYDPQDRRIIKVKLTPKGKELIKKIDCQRKEMLIKIFSKLSADDRQEYLRIVTQIKDILIREGLDKA